jgi:hypothetical protein
MIKLRKLFGGLGNNMFQYAYLYSQLLDKEIPDLYLQDIKYWEHNKEEIRQLYGVTVKKECQEYVSLHIRRGDYVGNSFYVDLTRTDYYDKAIKEFKGEKFLVFCADRQEGSDDEADKYWCKEWLDKKGIDFAFYHGKDEIEDMNAMASCKGHIMANSSFSWWASFLGGGKTVAPIHWFTDGKERIKLLDSWKKI